MDMNLDQLAAAVIGADPGSTDDLRKLLETFQTLQQAGWRGTEKAVALLQSLLDGKAEDPDQALKAVAEIVAGLHPPSSGNANQPDAGTDPADSELLDPEILSEFVTESREHLQAVEANLLAVEADASDKESLNAAFRAFHSTKGTASFLGLEEIKTLAHHAEQLMDRARKGEIVMAGDYADLELQAADMLCEMIAALAEYQGGALPAAPAGFPQMLARLERAESGTVQEKVSAPVAQPSAPSAVPAASAPAAVSPAESAGPAAAGSEETKKAKAGSDLTVRVSTQRLDHLIDMVGELMITNAMIAQNPCVLSNQDHMLSSNVMQLGKIARELQDLSMSLRMVPFRTTFQKVERLVRDLSHKSGKHLRFISEGEDTEIDRNMVELLYDPLVHMIRNAVDHGLEPAQERLAQGKPAEGQLRLRAYQASGSIVLELQDDGRGLNREKILAKAREKGLADPNQEYSDRDIYRFIFEPGFSTAEKVTDISGRGVGMDVVRRNVESIRGRVELASEPGRGTTFTLKIPLTLAIIDGMLLSVAGQEYILPTLNVKHALRPEPTSLTTVAGRGEMLRFRNQLIPLFRLHRLFDLEGAVTDPTQALLIIVEHETDQCALMAERLLGQQHVIIKSLGEGLGGVEGVSGAAILGDGGIRMILDVEGIMRLAWGGPQGHSRRPAWANRQN